MKERIEPSPEKKQSKVLSQIAELNPAFERMEKKEKLDRMLNEVMPGFIEKVINKTSAAWFEGNPVKSQIIDIEIPELNDEHYDSIVAILPLNEDLNAEIELIADRDKWPLSGNPNAISAVGIGVAPRDEKLQEYIDYAPSAYYGQQVFNIYKGQIEDSSSWQYNGPDDPEKFAKMIDFIDQNLES